MNDFHMYPYINYKSPTVADLAKEAPLAIRPLYVADRAHPLSHKTQSALIPRPQKLLGRETGAASLRVHSHHSQFFTSLLYGLSNNLWGFTWSRFLAVKRHLETVALVRVVSRACADTGF
jgi:hypothetical protein